MPRHFSLSQDLNGLIDIQHYNEALSLIIQVAQDILGSKLAACELGGCVELDTACHAIGLNVLNQLNLSQPSSRDPDCDVYIATEVYAWGGHSRWLADLMLARCGRKAILLLTDTLTQTANYQAVPSFLQATAVEVAPASLSHVERLTWLFSRIVHYNPSQLNFMTHMKDAVAIAAAQSGLADRLIFFHHCDHDFSLGMYIPNVLHVDFRKSGYANCRLAGNIQDNVYIPLISDSDYTAERRFKDRNFTTCTSGESHKFEGPYSYSLAEVLPDILTSTEGRHYHIGTLSPSMIENIRKGLNHRGIAAERFILIKRVPNLWEKLVELEVDLYLDSFPLGGCKSVVDIMGAGIPVIVHNNYSHQLLCSSDIVYPEAAAWQSPSQLIRVIQALSREWLQEQSALSRDHYKREHHPSLLSSKLEMVRMDNMSNLRPTVIPDMPRWSLASLCDHIQTLLAPNGYLLGLYVEGAQQQRPSLRTGLARYIELDDELCAYLNISEVGRAKALSEYSALVTSILAVVPTLARSSTRDSVPFLDKAHLSSFLYSIAEAASRQRESPQRVKEPSFYEKLLQLFRGPE